MKTKINPKSREASLLKILQENQGSFVSYKKLLEVSIKNPIEKLMIFKDPKRFKKEAQYLRFLIYNITKKFPKIKIKNISRNGYLLRKSRVKLHVSDF